MKIVYLVGSLAQESINRRLVQALIELAPEGVEFVEAEIKDLPLYNRDLDGNWPEVATKFKQTVAEADAVLLVTPEHNRTISSALHNAIEWTSRPYGQWALAGKPVATIGASPSGLGTAPAQQHLRGMLQFFNVKLMGQPEGYINASDTGLASGELTESATEFLASWIKAFVEFAKD
ncbi:MAG: NADPH-dependent FMN reductase [Arcanobacterium sp.]